MDTMTLDGPDGVDVRLGSDASLTEHQRRHLLARDLIAVRLNVRHDDIRLRRDAPGAFGHHTHLIASVNEAELPLVIKGTSHADVTVVGVADLSVPLGLDIRSASPDEAALAEMRRHSHLFPDTDAHSLLQHWTRVEAVRQADGRGARLQPRTRPTRPGQRNRLGARPPHPLPPRRPLTRWVDCDARLRCGPALTRVRRGGGLAER